MTKQSDGLCYGNIATNNVKHEGSPFSHVTTTKNQNDMTRHENLGLNTILKEVDQHSIYSYIPQINNKIRILHLGVRARRTTQISLGVLKFEKGCTIKLLLYV